MLLMGELVAPFSLVGGIQGRLGVPTSFLRRVGVFAVSTLLPVWATGAGGYTRSPFPQPAQVTIRACAR
jgi:hypothetical protein